MDTPRIEFLHVRPAVAERQRNQVAEPEEPVVGQKFGQRELARLHHFASQPLHFDEERRPRRIAAIAVEDHDRMLRDERRRPGLVRKTRDAARPHPLSHVLRS